MKNTRIRLLVWFTCIFAAFIVGLFIGRNQNPVPVQIQTLPAAVTAREEVNGSSASSPVSEPTATEPVIININTATSEQLQTLPSIGPVIANRIIAYRTENGAFASTAELLNVSGIGEKKLEAILDLITTGG